MPPATLQDTPWWLMVVRSYSKPHDWGDDGSRFGRLLSQAAVTGERQDPAGHLRGSLVKVQTLAWLARGRRRLSGECLVNWQWPWDDRLLLNLASEAWA
jgi:hypothetical protein